MAEDLTNDLEGDIRAAMETVSRGPEAAPDAPADTPAPAPAPQTEGEKARDEQGRFAKTEAKPDPKAKAPEFKPVDAKAAEAAPVQAAASQPIAPKTETIAAPTNWKGAGKVAWDRLPQAIQKEITDDYSRNAETSGRLDRLDNAIGKERAMTLAATYGTVEAGITNLLAMSEMATKNPTGFVLWFCQQRGINLAQMVGQPQGAQQAPQQAPDPVMQRMGQLETMLTNFVQQQQGAQTQGAQTDIERFASDPAHPYFNDVRADMGALIQMGRAKDLQQAYDMAVWAHSDIRSSLIENQMQGKSQAQAQAAQQARNASVSVSGSPAGAQVSDAEPDETLEQTLTRVQRRVLNA